MIIGYITAILGGVLGFIIAIFLITRKDPYARKHGFIQLSILICWVMLIGALVLTGQMDLNVLLNPMNTTQLENLTQNASVNSTNLFGL